MKFYVSKICVTVKRFTDATLNLEKKINKKNKGINTTTIAITSICKTGIIYVSFKMMCII